uniref:Uncharacterized protein n=1 Tax=Rhizophora mucronata TaxID=61149 RepID=A0A2P2NHT9_RHIMU
MLLLVNYLPRNDEEIQFSLSSLHYLVGGTVHHPPLCHCSLRY